MRLIDADAFIHEQCNSCDGACEALPCDCLNCDSDCRCDMIQDLQAAPTISPDEVRGVGKWIEVEQQMGWYDEPCAECSVCGEDFVFGELDMEYVRNLFRFCPNCGARMTEVSDDA